MNLASSSIDLITFLIDLWIVIAVVSLDQELQIAIRPLKTPLNIQQLIVDKPLEQKK